MNLLRYGVTVPMSRYDGVSGSKPSRRLPCRPSIQEYLCCYICSHRRIARSSSRGNDQIQPSSVRGRRPPGLWNRNKSLSSLLALHEASRGEMTEACVDRSEWWVVGWWGRGRGRGGRRMAIFSELTTDCEVGNRLPSLSLPIARPRPRP